MAVIELDSFEHGIVGLPRIPSASAVGTPTITTSTPKNGSRCLEISAAAAAETMQWAIAAGKRQLAFSFYVRFVTSLPGSGVGVFTVTNASGNMQVRYANTPQRLAIRMAGGADVDVGPVLAADTWYLVDVKVDTSTGTAQLWARVDGGTEQTQTNVQVAADNTAVRLGTTAAATYTGRFDDLVIADTLAEYPIGEHVIEQLVPVADGTHSSPGNFVDGGAAAISGGNPAFGDLDEVPWETATGQTRVAKTTAGAAGDYLELNMGAIAHATYVPRAVFARVTRYDSSGTGNTPAEARAIAPDGTSTTIHGSVDPGATLTMYAVRVQKSGDGAWARADLDAAGDLKVRLGFSNDVSPNPIWQGVYAEVLLTPSTAATLTRSAAMDATGAIVVAARTRIVPRASVIAATGAIDSAKRIVRVRAAVVSATGAIDSTKRIVRVRSSAIAAVGAIVVAHRRDLLRQLGIAGVAAIVTAQRRDVLRQAAIAGTGSIDTVARRVLPRTSAIAATGAIATVATPIRVRSAAIAATAAITATHRRDLLRTSTLAGVGAITVDAERALVRAAAIAATGAIATAATPVRVRSASISATGAITAAHERELLRQVALDATGAITVDRELVALRAVALGAVGAIAASATPTRVRSTSMSATAAITAAHRRDLIRAAAISALGSLATVRTVDLIRQASIAGVGTITASATSGQLVERAASIAATAAIAAEFERDLIRQVTVSGVGAITAARQVARIRSASIAAAASIVATTRRDLHRSASLAATAQIVAIARRELVRRAGLDATAALSVVADIVSGQPLDPSVWDVLVPGAWPEEQHAASAWILLGPDAAWNAELLIDADWPEVD